MSVSSLTGRKRTVAFVLKDGKRGLAVEYLQAPFPRKYIRFIDVAVWPEGQPEKLREYTTLDVRTDMIETFEEAPGGRPESGETSEKTRRKKREA